MLKAFKYVFDFVAAIVIVIILYIIVGITGSLIPVNTKQPSAEKEFEIFIQSNGVHTDIVMPLKNEILDWRDFVDPSHTRAGNVDFAFVAFGWGDLGFYETTPEWSDLKPGIAFRAMFLDSPAAMHVKFKHYMIEDENSISIMVTEKQYEALVGYILKSFSRDGNGAPLNIPNLHYAGNDTFYQAEGSLTLLKTCNTWTNNALKHAGLPASLWTPFVEGIFYSYSRY
ncbi:TIGR02117 family protein [Antarcticibacterium arcticum]|uniref:TIGR02117 family protein n=1 Tax=Antarcticibacterium arcticum TaxID=2585771 RepID=A0A5B8YI37_9FLAO|nr:TIGR02117 family protein [Antarcticibacterium arcticum]QED37610.1 TIGR02117 family protein [Antarcticibacterium arcticum]